MESIIHEILYLNETTDMSLSSILYKVLSKYNFELKKNELVSINDSWQIVLISYFERMLIKGMSKGSINNYKCILKNALSIIGKPLSEITTDDISLYITYKKNICNCSLRYLDNIKKVLNSFFTWCYKNKYVLFNPVDGVDDIKVPEKKVYGFTDEEVEQMRNACENTRYKLRNRCIVELLNSLGIRCGELINLNVEDIDLNNCSGVIYHGKGDKERIFYFSKITRYYLKKYLKLRNINETDNVPLFVNNKNKRFAGADGIENIISTLGKYSGVKHAHPHRFRHTFITNCINKGMRIEDTKQLVGHSNIENTMIYYDENMSKVRDSYNKLYS